jgi:murein L,D-transpeptidase YafK
MLLKSCEIKRKSLIVVTLIVLGMIGLLVWAHIPGAPLPSTSTADSVLVEKALRRLTLYQGTNVLRQYRVSLGRRPVGDKEREGDKKTPEGLFTVDRRKLDSSFHLALHISYPDESHAARAKARGVSPGSDIMIHGIRNGLFWAGKMHRWIDWTAGCIAVTDWEIEEIAKAVPDGTRIVIRP